MTAYQENLDVPSINEKFSRLPDCIHFLSNPFRNSFSRQEYITSVVESLAQWTGCECVGIRILEPTGVMPYEAYVGFTKEFWESENCLSVLEHECACTRIVTGEPDTWDQPLLTPCGSIFTDDLQGFAKNVPEEFLPRYRGKCIGSQFETLAVIPIRYHSQVVGLLHIADHKGCMLSAEDLLLLESLSDAIAEVINKFNVSEALHQREVELKALEDRLHQSHKMEAVGNMASSIAHDFNNLLTAIVGNLEIINILPEPKSRELTRSLDNIRDVTEQAANITKQLLAFSRKEYDELTPHVFTAVIDEAFQLLHRTIPPSVEVVKNFTAESIVDADVTQLKQVVANLCSNALHAMNGQGVLKVSVTEEALTGEHPLMEQGREPGQYAVLSVVDTGCGIGNDIITKIFDPFYTTKPVGEGVGLGLSVVQNALLRHNGFVTVESKIDQGTAFKVYLPVASGQK